MESENENYDLKKENYILEILNNKFKKKLINKININLCLI